MVAAVTEFVTFHSVYLMLIADNGKMDHGGKRGKHHIFLNITLLVNIIESMPSLAYCWLCVNEHRLVDKHTHAHTQNDYCNPHVCTLRVSK